MSDYTFAWQEKSSFMIMEANMITCTQGISDLFHVNFDDVLSFYKENQAYFYFSNDDIKKWEISGKQFLKKGYLEDFHAYTAELRASFNTCIGKIDNSDIKNAHGSELLDLFEEYFSIVAKSAGIYLGSAPESMFFVDKSLMDILAKYVDEENIHDVYATLCAPDEIDFVQQEKIDWLNLCKKKKVTNHELLAHAQTYAANFFNTYSSDTVIVYLKNRLKNTNVFELKKEVVTIKKRIVELNKKRSAELKKLPAKVDLLSNVIRKQSVDRLRLKNYWQGAEFLALRLFEEIAERIDIEIEQLFRAYGSKDIRAFLTSGKKLSEKEIKNREQYLMFEVLGKKINVSAGTLADKKIQNFFREYGVDTHDTVRGFSATNVSAVGRAYVMLVEGITEFMQASAEFRDGDILITTMTSPNMMLLMQKAGGIVTNEGGVCSHAAVISRELHMPCIVGTHDATRMFKTGDYVYINASEGQVSRVDKKFFEHNKNVLQKVTNQEHSSKYVRNKINYHLESKKYIINFENIGKEDVLSVGGKGASLGEMFRHFPVPKGLCVTTHAFGTFVGALKKEIQKELSIINYEDPSAMEIVTDEIRRKILNKSWPSDLEQKITKSCADLFGNRYMCVSVRSSATAEDLPNASFAGQQDTFLFVNGIANVLDSIKKCFASLYTTRAVLYRKKNNISERDLYMAVVVQDMIDPEYAGVGFSVDPISRNEDVVLIETAPGVGEHVVSGSLTPDTYLHNIKTNKIEKKLSGKKQIMKDAQIQELSKIIKKIEFHYKYPQDIEWAVDKAGKIWILQSRPITTL